MDPTPDAAPDRYLSASVVLSRGDKFYRGKVIGSKSDSKGNPIERDNANPFLHTRRYEVEFRDVRINKITENVIEESMYEQVDSEDNDTLLMDGMVDYDRIQDSLQNKSSV